MITNTVRLFMRGLTPSYYRKEVHLKGGGEIRLPLNGVAFSMRICGYGNYAIYDGKTVNAIPFDTGFQSKIVKGFIKNGGYIMLYGDTSFSVYDYSVYSEICSSRESDIPDGSNRISHDIRTLCSDFMAFVELPKDSWGNTVPNSVLRDGKVEVDSDYKGEIVLTYRKLPTEIINDPQTVIDIPEEYSHLLTLLTAHYFLLDADESKAKYYRNMYNEALSNMETHSYEQIENKYIDVNGWA